MMRRLILWWSGGALACALCARPVAGAEASPASAATASPAAGGDSLLQQEQKQLQLKTTTKRVGDQLEHIIAEFDRNGIAGEDVKVLRAIRSVLDQLSDKDMARVIEFLQQARGGDAAVSTRTATEAYAAQKSIIVQLQQLVLEYQRQQALYELSIRLKELAGRQTVNMWNGVGLAKSAEGKASFTAFDENQKISLKYQQSEQNPLRDETAAIVRKLERLSVEITDGATADRPKAALQHARQNGLLTALETASTELKEDNLRLMSAVGNEKNARDQLREMARLLILSQDATDALKQAILELERAIETQKKVREDTAATKKRDEADKRATDQAATVDEADLIRKDIESIAPVASEYLRAATDRMQEARGALSANEDPKQRVEQAVPKQDDALLQMQLARLALEEQLARAEAREEQPENALAALRKLQEDVRELIQKEEALKSEAEKTPEKALPAKAPIQGELKDTAQRLQVKAAAPSPLAAQAIGDAASEMQKSQNSFAQLQNNPGAQQAAIDSLQRAEQQLGQDIEKLEQAEKDLAKLEEILKRLVAIIEEQQKVETVTMREVFRPAPVVEVMQALVPRETALARDTEAIQQEASQPAPKAAQYLGSAKSRMETARAALEKNDAKTAQPREQEALADLYRAKSELERKMDELRQMLGQPPSQSADALAEAQQSIQKAQQKVNEALSELQQAPPGLMEALQKQQQEIASALKEMRQDSPDSKPLLAAHQAATEAAQQMAKSNLPQAVNSMKAAEGALEQAKQNGAPSEPVAKQQTEVRKAAESLAAAQQAASAASLQKASDALQEAANEIGPLAAGAKGKMPFGAQSALQSARSAASQGSAQASSQQNTPAQMSATEAANALAQAQAALALAQAGLGSQMAAAGQGQTPGQGQSQGQGQGQSPGQGQGRTPGKGSPSPQGTGNDGNWEGAGGASGNRGGANGVGTFSRLPNRDRAAIQQSQSEKYPQEFGPLVEQYLKNLSDQADRK